MKLFINETHKILGARYIWIALCIMLLLNVYLVSERAKENVMYSPPADEVDKVFDLYINDRDDFDEKYAQYKEKADLNDRLRKEALSRGDYEYKVPKIPNVIASDATTDGLLYNELFKRIEYVQSYKGETNKIIHRAYDNLAEFEDSGLDESAYIVKYQNKVIKYYEKCLEEVKIGFENIRGWETLFTFETTNIFIFFFVIMISAALFTAENQSGFASILRSVRRGRAPTSLAKLGVLFISSIIAVLLFTFSNYLCVGAVCGYSSQLNAIQALPKFISCRHIITIGEYFIYSILIKIAGTLAFSALASVIAISLKKIHSVYICEVILMGINLILAVVEFGIGMLQFNILNLFTATSSFELYMRYRAVNFFSEPAGYVEFFVVSCFVILLAGYGVSSLLFCKLRTVTVIRSTVSLRNIFSVLDPKKIADKIRTAANSAYVSKQRKGRKYSLSLFSHEMFKLNIVSRAFIGVIIILTAKAFFVPSMFENRSEFSDSIFKEYMIVLNGEYTEEKSRYIAEERNRLNSVVAQHNSMNQKYIDGEIPFAEYEVYLREYYSALSAKDVFYLVDERDAYLRELNEEGIKANFLYDTGWKKLFESDPDLFLISAALLVFCAAYSCEHSKFSSGGEFAAIIRPTVKSSAKTSAAKFLSVIVTSFILFVLFYAQDIIFIAKEYGLQGLRAPLVSVFLMQNVKIGMEIWQYLVFLGLLRFMGVLTVSFISCAMSELIRSVVASISVSAAVVLLPYAIMNFSPEISFLKYIDITSLLSGTELVLMSFNNGGFSTLVFFVCGAILFTSALSVWAFKKFNGATVVAVRSSTKRKT